jgi:phospholipid/cholesterol/gamma-HCH transport system substrate-binding protein
MKNRAQKIRLGIFVAFTATILLLLVGLFTTQRLFKERDVYFIAYRNVSVSGLEVGSPVKFLGIKVGTVQDVKIDPQDVNQILLKVALTPGTPIKQDAQADIATMGITGLKAIEIRGGSNEAPFVKEGGFIPAGSSMTEEITGKAEVIAEKIEGVLNNLYQFTQPNRINKISHMVDSIIATANSITSLVSRADNFLGKVDNIVEMNRQQVEQAIDRAGEINENLIIASQMLQATATRVNMIVQSDTLDHILSSAREVANDLKEANLKELITSIAQVIDQTNMLLVKIDQDMDRGSEDFSASMSLLRSTMFNLDRATRLINDDPSVLLRGTRPSATPDKHLKR